MGPGSEMFASTSPELGESEIELVMRPLEGDISAITRARAVNRTWCNVCSLPTLWKSVRWPMTVALSDEVLLLVSRLSGYSLRELDFCDSTDSDSEEYMLRASSACCFEWSLDKLRAGLRAETLAYVIQACSSSLRGLSFAGLPVDAALSPLTRCSALTRLDLAGCSLDDQHLPGLNNVLANTLTLSQLDLSANELGQGHLLELRHLPNLTSLSLSMNRLRTLPQDVSTLSSLTLLHLGANALDAVPDALRCLNRLTDLDLGSNQLYSVPVWMASLTRLRFLSLRSLSRRHAPPNNHPNTQHLPVVPDLSGLRHLERLDLSDCDLWDMDLPRWVLLLDRLHTLDLSDNHLTSFPLSHHHLPLLRRLALSNQGPWEGDAPLPGAEGAAEMFALQGGMMFLPDSLLALPSLSKLSLDNTRVARWPLPPPHERTSAPLPPATRPSHLCPIAISGTDSSRCEASPPVHLQPPALLPHRADLRLGLEYLSLTGTGLVQVPQLAATLLVLNLSSNKITTLPEDLRELRKLWYLSVSNNHLSCIPAVIGSLTRLQELYVARNHIIILSPALFALGNLEVLDLSMNPIVANTQPSATGHWAPSRAASRAPQSADDSRAPQTADAPCSETLFLLRNTPPEYQGGLDPFALTSDTLVPASGTRGAAGRAELWCQLTSLQNLVLVDTGLSRLPRWLEGQCMQRSLKHLCLGGNRCIGTFPPEVTRLHRLQLLSFSACAIQGVVPDCILSLTHLESLSLDRNRFTGLPDGLSRLTNLRRLELHDNRLTSTAPLAPLTFLAFLSLHGNPPVTTRVPGNVLMEAYLDGLVHPLLQALSRDP